MQQNLQIIFYIIIIFYLFDHINASSEKISTIFDTFLNSSIIM